VRENSAISIGHCLNVVQCVCVISAAQCVKPVDIGDFTCQMPLVMRVSSLIWLFLTCQQLECF